MHTVPLLSLAPELVHVVAQNLARKDLKNLRSTCKRLGLLLESNVLHTVVLNVNKRNFNTVIPMLQSMVADGAASRAVRHLILGSLSPRYDPHESNPSFAYISNEFIPNRRSEDGPEIGIAEREMKKYLSDCLMSLRGLHWKPEKYDEEWAQNVVVDVLESLPALQKLDVMLVHSRIALPLELLPNIREISLQEHSGLLDKSHNSQTFTSLAKMIARLPPGQLTGVHIEREWTPGGAPEAPGLHDLFQFCSADAPPVQLRHLGVKYSFVKLDQLTAPHFRHLTSLALINVMEPTEIPVVRRQPHLKALNPHKLEPEVLARQRRVGSTLSQFWLALHREGIHLESIRLDDVVPGFIEYLTFYSGIKVLDIVTAKFRNAVESDEAANQFFRDPLANHVDSLEELHIYASYEGLWCFGEHNSTSISNCKRLRILSVCVLSDGLETSLDARGDVTLASNNSIKVLIATAVSTLPLLTTLNISPSDKESNRQYRGPTMSVNHLISTRRRITRNIVAFRGPASYAKLPIITIWTRNYEPKLVSQREGDTTQWCYQEIVDPRPEEMGDEGDTQ
ncbi:hypothetical protein BDZ97DRAFT_1915995 [Flammula alnicola]|nr:hypothetical protein BDZ97DRAFT_1915995 [Flammula alnicola]